MDLAYWKYTVLIQLILCSLSKQFRLTQKPAVYVGWFRVSGCFWLVGELEHRFYLPWSKLRICSVAAER